MTVSNTIPQTTPAAGPPGAPLADEVERLREQVLDLGEHLATMTAEHGADRARIKAFLAALALARTWPLPGGAAPGGGPLPGTGAQGGAHAGPRVLKAQARRRRIEASGLRGLPGGAR